MVFSGGELVTPLNLRLIGVFSPTHFFISFSPILSASRMFPHPACAFSFLYCSYRIYVTKNENNLQMAPNQFYRHGCGFSRAAWLPPQKPQGFANTAWQKREPSGPDGSAGGTSGGACGFCARIAKPSPREKPRPPAT